MSNRTIEAVLKLSSKLGSMRAFNRLDEKMMRVERKAKALNRVQGRIAQSSKVMGAAMMRYAAPAAVVYGLGRAVTDYADIERRLEYIAINADKGKDAAKGMLDTVNQLSHDYAMSQGQVTSGLETLVAKGMDLKQAMAFLPSVLATAQASGAAASDLADSAQAMAKSFGIGMKDMQKAFDIADRGGQLGQFELKDMAHYLPELSATFKTLGYKGLPGLRKLIALLQTVRKNTGSSEAAATDLKNIFQKIYSRQTAANFKKFGVDLDAYFAKAKANGEDVLEAFIKITRQVTKGDPTKLSRLFTDTQFYEGMQALLQSPEALKKFNAELKNADGTVMKNLGTILSDNRTKIDRLTSSWKRLWTSLGAAASDAGATGAMNSLSDRIDYGLAVDRGLDDSGVKGTPAHIVWGITHGDDAKKSMAFHGGYISPHDQKVIDTYQSYAKSRMAAPKNVPSMPSWPVSELPALQALGVPPDLQGRPLAPANVGMNVLAGAERRLGLSNAGADVAKGGEDAGRAISRSANDIRKAGTDAAATIARSISRAFQAERARGIGPRDVYGPGDL